MKLNFNGNAEDISMILVSAERYALGRSTYIVSWTCETIKNNLHLLTDKDKQVMITDIKQAKYFGQPMDKAEWLSLLKVLEERN